MMDVVLILDVIQHSSFLAVTTHHSG